MIIQPSLVLVRICGQRCCCAQRGNQRKGYQNTRLVNTRQDLSQMLTLVALRSSPIPGLLNLFQTDTMCEMVLPVILLDKIECREDALVQLSNNVGALRSSHSNPISHSFEIHLPWEDEHIELFSSIFERLYFSFRKKSCGQHGLHFR